MSLMLPSQMSSALGRSDYTPPADLPQKTLGWLAEALQESDYYLRSQQGWGRAAETKRMIFGDSRPARPDALSTTSDNEFGRLYTVASADYTDIRAYWQYECMNAEYEQQAQIQSNILDWWFPKYGEAPTELIAKLGLIYGTGVGAWKWDARKQEIMLDPRNPHDVGPVRPAGDFLSYQDCLAVNDRRERPVHYVRQMFPHAAHLIHMERDASVASMMANAETKVYGRSPLQIAKSMASPPVARLGAIPVVDLFYTYIDDPSVNTETFDVEMGDWGYAADDSGRRVALNDWSYRVKPDAPLYPYKRLIIWTRTVILYDGPNMYLHGMFPYTKFTINSVPDSWFGLSPLWRCLPLQRSLDKLYRAIDDHVALVMNPGKQAPKLGVSRNDFNKYKTNLPGQQTTYGPAGKIERDEIAPLDEIIERQIDRILTRMQQHMGVQQLAALLQMGQMPEGSSIEKILQTQFPEIRAVSRSLERFQREGGEMFAYNVMQFYPLGKRIQMLGNDGQTIEDYDIDPDSLVPAYTASDYDNTGRLKEDAHTHIRPRAERIREHGPKFSLFIKPTSMLNSAQTQERLMYLTLRRQGDLDLDTTLRKMDIPNLGPKPQGTVLERVMQEKAAAAGMVPGMPGAEGGGGNPGTGTGNGPMGAHRGPGHPPSAQKPPHMRGDGRIEES